MKRKWLLALAAALLFGARPARAQGGEVVALTFDGPLTPALAAYVQRGITQAERDSAELVILRLNTPGGQIDLMEDIVASIRDSAVPVVVYVAPRGAMAGSAGTVITLAGHAAAMAPETVIGAASPVGSQGEDIGSTLESKIKEALKAKVRALAARRPPAAVALAEATIESAKAATADEAFAVGLVDFLARDDADLLTQLEGYTVQLDSGPRTLHTAGRPVVEIPANFLEALLNFLTNPNVVFLLLALGAQAILIEISSPGGWVAGAVGVTALALAFYGLGVLPVNWFGIVFILLAFVLFILDIKAPTHGALTFAGTTSLVAGALVLFNSPGTPQFQRVSVPLVVVTAVIMAAFFAVILAFALRAQKRPIAVGVESLIGQEGEARGSGSVQVAGELWSAEAAEPLQAGQKVIVEAVKGLRVVVRKK
jgi:membrane-bound serine protease (ClpP class)